MTTTTPKCEFSGCKKPVAWECTRLYGKGGTFHTCADHKPGAKADTLPAALAAKLAGRSFYDCKPYTAKRATCAATSCPCAT